jgi:TPR repeat protein
MDFDLHAAARYFKFAADQGIAPAQFYHGLCLQNGIGI